MTPPLLLAGDTGGTKTTLAIYDCSAWPILPAVQQTLQNRNFKDFPTLIASFLDSTGLQPTLGCFGVAGLVMENRVQLTNLNWSIDASELQSHFGFRQVHLINDLMATALGATYLAEEEFSLLHPGHASHAGTVAVLAPGTGLGEAFALYRDGRYHPAPSEGGHASFAPRTDLQLELLTYMMDRHEHVSVENVCSGIALPDLYDFVCTKIKAPEWLSAELEGAKDRTPPIVKAAVEAKEGGRPCDTALHTLQLFTDILADEAANLALKTLCHGGLYLGGGLAPRIQPLLDARRFMTVFTRGIYREMLADIPIRIILNPKAALLGAAAYGCENLG